ncbi:hypothetical protein H0H93_006298 [Arthromyces matolae]|nr:hypothetical protein H0H93_006298 [Arthromyces matolae]
MSSDPTPPPPGDNSLASWQDYETRAAEKDREIDRETIDKMLDFQRQFVPPSKVSDPSTAEGSSSLVGKPLLKSPPGVSLVVEPPSESSLKSLPGVSLGVEMPSESGPLPLSLTPASIPIPTDASSLPSEVVPPSLPVKKTTVLRKMSSKPQVSAEDRKRINSDLQKTGPSRVQMLAAANEVGHPSQDWWRDHAPIDELARLHPEWPRWWIGDREREGWLKKPRGGKTEAPETKAGSSRVPSKAKGKRKAQSEEEEESNWESSSQDADGDSDPEAVVEVAPRSPKRPRLATTHEFRPYSKPPGPTPLPGRPVVKPVPSKTSKVREVFVLVPPLTTPQVPTSSNLAAIPSKSDVPLFAPSETPEVVLVSPPPSKPVLVLDPKSPLNIRIPPRPPRLPSPPTVMPPQEPSATSPDLETRNQIFEGTQFSRGDVLRGRLADARHQSLVFGQGLEQFTTHASAWSLQLESFRREFQERGFEPSSRGARFIDHVIEESRRMAVQWGDVLNAGNCEHMRSVTSGVSMPSQQDLIDEMDKEGMDARWER